LAAIAVGLILFYGHVAFIPVALALLFAVILMAPVEALNHIGIPRGVSAPAIIVCILAFMAGMVNVVAEPAQQWFSAAPRTLKVIEHKLRPIAGFVRHADDLIDSAGRVVSPTKATAPAAEPVQATVQSTPVWLLDVTRTALVGLGAVAILTLFLLTGGPPMLARMTSVVVSDLNAAHVADVILKLRGELGRYYVTTSFINLGLGVLTAAAMALCGMPNPLLWGTVAGALNFIPYVGPTVTLMTLSIVAFVSFDGWAHVAAVAASFLTLTTLEGQLVQPMLVGRRLDLNPILVFLALWFGGFFWGVAGIFLATPALVTLKVIAENSRDGKPLLAFLGPERCAAKAQSTAAHAQTAAGKQQYVVAR
jgi:predicted PurR-regulated permease PerM